MNKRIESKTSRTAEMTCFSRAASFNENREEYKSGDYISQIIVPSFIKPLIKISFIRRRFIEMFNPKGIYEYVIARTRFIDSEFAKALNDGYEQILIFGAGFDSRAIRFKDISQNAKIFEMDVPVTQEAKIGRYKEKGITIPDNLIFIPIDFDTQSISQRLYECGFKKDKKSMFILEGLTMYLQPESMDNTFKIISDYSGEGSKILFDHIYTSVVRRENLYYGEKGMYERAAKVNEQWIFGIERGETDQFVSKYGFQVCEVLDSDSLEKRFFMDRNGMIKGRVNGTHCLVSAIKT